MADGVYQSVMSFFIPYMAVAGATFVSMNGLDVSDRLRLGCYIAHPAVITINMYILLNTYQWDWIMLLVVLLSDLFVFFWTAVYTATSYSVFFYQAAPQVYQELTFWLVFLITPVICLFPRFAIKSIQKVYFPYDVDIIREQITMGKFKKEIDAAKAYIDADQARYEAMAKGEDPDLLKGTGTVSSDSSDTRRSAKSSRSRSKHAQYASIDEDRRPIYPPSVAPTHNRNTNGSNGTNFTRPSHDLSRELTQEISHDMMAGTTPHPTTSAGPSADRPRPSYDRMRMSMDAMRPSMDRVRASFEQSNDFTTAARLSRIESSHSAHNSHHNSSPGQRRFNLNTVRKRGLSVFSKKSIDTDH